MSKKMLLCAIGVQGSIGTTIATGIETIKFSPNSVLDYLITNRNDSALKGIYDEFEIAGWDLEGNSFFNSFIKNKPVKTETFNSVVKALENKKIFTSPNFNQPIFNQVEQIRSNIQELKITYEGYDLVAINILPASEINFDECNVLSLQEITKLSGKKYRDLAYLIACIKEGIPFINFTPNPIELEAIIKLAEENNTTLCGRDGKTGQTYFKVVLASAFKARSLIVKGWYSTNILGNDDGKNLNDKKVATNKIRQKGVVLDRALGYHVQDHIVHIDYYSPRGDNKEANDIIDFNGFLDEEMSMRVNVLCKDSVLAAPMIIDMAVISAYLKYTLGKKGLLTETSFFYKLPVGSEVKNTTFESQLTILEKVIRCKGEYSNIKI
jgi:myo-inositol-1-phosphate synthase